MRFKQGRSGNKTVTEIKDPMNQFDKQSDDVDTPSSTAYSSWSDQPSTTKLPGNIVGGRYKVLSVIGHGAIGSVYKVEQLAMKKTFALKILSCGNASERTLLRFRQEAKAASKLDHPNLVRAIDYWISDTNQPFLVMELVEGQTPARTPGRKRQFAPGGGSSDLHSTLLCYGLRASRRRHSPRH